MSRWGFYGKLDTQEAHDGDWYFTGMDMVRERGLLQPGILARSENKRLRNGTADTRLGTVLPADFVSVAGTELLGSAVYNNPNGDEVILVAEKNASYVTVLAYGKDPVQINMSGGNSFTTTDGVEFVQCFDKVVALRRPALARPIMMWDGQPAGTGHSGTFDPMALSTFGRKLVPQNSWWGQPFKDRIIYYSAYRPDLPWRDQLIVSDVGDPTSYDDVFGVYRINSGQSDLIVRVWPYFRNGIVIFKAKTLHFLSKFTLDPTAAVQQPFSVNRGAVGARSMVEVGNDVMFLSEPGGIYRLTEIIQEKISTEPAPASEGIQPIIDRINWPAAKSLSPGGACSATVDVYTFFGVPLDGAPANNAVIVYNNGTRQWEGLDTWLDPNFQFHAFHVATYGDARRLYAVDYKTGTFYLMYEGLADETAGSINEIEDLIETRGYAMNDPNGFKRFHRTQIGLNLQNAEVFVTAISDGYNEEKVITEEPITKSRLKFYPHGHDDFDPETGDPDEQLRKDYSTSDFGAAATQDFEALPEGEIWEIPGTPLPLAGPLQQSLERMALRQNGRWVSLRIENSNGRCHVLSVGVDGTPVLETVRAVA
jgi:hypothetical protein